MSERRFVVCLAILVVVCAVLGWAASKAVSKVPPSCNGHQHTLASHMKWDKDIWRSEAPLSDRAVDRHKHYSVCAKSSAHRKAMRVRWKKIRQSLLPPNHDLWVRIGRCEQPGPGYKGVNWSFPGPTFQGGLGFYFGTWDGYKPRGFPADAGSASWRQQMRVANILLGEYGTSPWGCA